MNKIIRIILNPRNLPSLVYGYFFICFTYLLSRKPGRVISKFGFFSYERSSVYQWLDSLKNHSQVSGKVLDVGSGPSGFTKKLFNDSAVSFLNVDVEEGPGVDVICSIYDLRDKFDENSIDAILCCDVFEHLPDPFSAINEIYHILKSGGKLFLTVPFNYRLHGSESTKDYFRYTKDGLKYICKDFKSVKVEHSGPTDFPYAYFVTAIK